MFDNDGPWENNSIEDQLDESTEVNDERDLCDCDPEHKETQVIQQSRGASFGGLGGQMGDGMTVIVCTKCGGQFPVNDRTEEEDDFPSLL